MRRNVHVRITRAGTGRPTAARPQGVPSPTQHIPFDPEAASLFQVISRRYQKGSIILTTNRSVAAWGDIFSDTTIAAAMLDRLLHRSVVFTITGDSYRLRGYHAQARKHRPKGVRN